jgi:hypothetical protein
MSDGLATKIKEDPSEQTIQMIATQLNIPLTPEETNFIKETNVEIESFCVAIQPIQYDGNGGKSR